MMSGYFAKTTNASDEVALADQHGSHQEVESQAVVHPSPPMCYEWFA
jgi:hypothetical protein